MWWNTHIRLSLKVIFFHNIQLHILDFLQDMGKTERDLSILHLPVSLGIPSLFGNISATYSNLVQGYEFSSEMPDTSFLDTLSHIPLCGEKIF